jgi:hypothetical protein
MGDNLSQHLYGRHPTKRFLFNQNTAATHQVVAAVPGKRIVLLNAFLKMANGQTLTWITGTSTAISGPMAFATSDLFYAFGDDDQGILETNVGERLALTLGAATVVAGHGTYAEV